MSIKTVGHALAIALVVCTPFRETDAQKAPPRAPMPVTRVKMTGTFTDFTYNREGGDVLGTEIRIVVGRHGLQATMQVAEGSPSDLMLALTVTEGQAGKIRFDLPANELDIRSVEGVVAAAAFTGTWTYTNGKTERIRLKRGRSYWE